MRRTIAMDPQTTGCGVAVFHGEVLFVAGFAARKKSGTFTEEVNMLAAAVRGVCRNSDGYRIRSDDRIIYELPKVYRPGVSKRPVPPDDLVKLAQYGATVATLVYADKGAEMVPVKPSEWKGGLPKDTSHRRILGKLSEGERACIHANKSVLEHVLDAVGIGLWSLGRMR